MIKMLQYKMYPAGELRCPTTALVSFVFCKYKGVETSLVVMKLLKAIANDLFAYNRQT